MVKLKTGEKRMILSSKELLPVVQNYLLDNMDFDGYDLDVTPSTKNEKLKAFNDIFMSEYGHNVGSMSRRQVLKEYLQGLPSCLTVKFYNGDIYNWLVDIGAASGNEKDDRIHELISNYWNVLPSKLNSMLNNAGIK